jgi:hypothetical protein
MLCLAAAAGAHEAHGSTTVGAGGTHPLPAGAAAFDKFPGVKVSVAGEWMLVESNGLPGHPMMEGIRTWQQQVPLPQPYTGSNAWKIPLFPAKAEAPTPLRNRFLRGAVAVAANGVPIFNPQNNRGEISQDIGELDRWGGHCGRADDYHYHVIPLHLAERTGDAFPVAYALDGYPIYGLREPDGKPMRPLDACGGHDDPVFGYHYHGTGKTPYVFPAFRGKVTEVDGQVDPQPRAIPVREAGSPLRGAVIVSCRETPLAGGGKSWTLEYTAGGRRSTWRWTAEGEAFTFWFPGSKEPVTYRRRSGGRGR